jgi:CBS domain-containing protein
MKVKDLMQTEVATLRESEALDIAEDIMNMGRIRHLPVVDANARLLGIVTQRDLFKASLSSVANVTPTERQQWLGKVRVREVMTKKPITVEPEAEMADAVDKLLTGGFGCLPVVEDGKFVGLITETDVLQGVQTLLYKKNRARPTTRVVTKSGPKTPR